MATPTTDRQRAYLADLIAQTQRLWAQTSASGDLLDALRYRAAGRLTIPADAATASRHIDALRAARVRPSVRLVEAAAAALGTTLSDRDRRAVEAGGGLTLWDLHPAWLAARRAREAALTPDEQAAIAADRAAYGRLVVDAILGA